MNKYEHVCAVFLQHCYSLCTVGRIRNKRPSVVRHARTYVHTTCANRSSNGSMYLRLLKCTKCLSYIVTRRPIPLACLYRFIDGADSGKGARGEREGVITPVFEAGFCFVAARMYMCINRDIQTFKFQRPQRETPDGLWMSGNNSCTYMLVPTPSFFTVHN